MFTSWHLAGNVDVTDWLDPHIFADSLMYPTLLDHDSPFTLGHTTGTGGGDEDVATALSYGLVGNRSLHIYFVVERSYIARIPVAWFDAGATLPAGPFPPLPLNSPGCPALRVSGAGLAGIDGVYRLAPGRTYRNRTFYEKGAEHQIYCSGSATRSCRWTISHFAHPPTFYESAGRGGELAPPSEGWLVGEGQAGVPPFPTVQCVS